MNKFKASYLAIFFASLITINISAQNGLAILVDESGSMRWPLISGSGLQHTCNGPIGTCADLVDLTSTGTLDPCTRYMTVFNALQLISDYYLSIAGDRFPGVGKVHLVRFPGDPTASLITEEFTADCSNPFKSTSGCIDIFDDVPTKILTNNVNIACTIHGTPLAEGLQVSNDLLHPGGTISPTIDKLILLICDGEPTDEFKTPLTSSEIQNKLDTYVRDDVKIVAIGIGNYTANDYFNLLNEIAQARNGRFFGYVPLVGSSTPGTWGGTTVQDFSNTTSEGHNFLVALEKQFSETLDYATVNDPVGTLNPGENREIPYTVTPLDTELVFAIHFDSDSINHYTVKIITPGGEVFMSGVPTRPGEFDLGDGNQDKYFFFFNRFIKNHYGEWLISFSAPQNNQRPVDFLYSIYTKSVLHASSNFSKGLFQTGDSFTGRVRIDSTNIQLKNLQVSVSVRSPVNWRGNWNACQKLNSKELAQIREGMPDEKGQTQHWTSDTPLADRKGIYLKRFKNQLFEERFSEKILTKPLFDDGKHNDGSAGDGIFNNRFLELHTPGLYKVLYTLKGTVANDSDMPFQRELLYHQYVDVKIEGSWDISKIRFEPGEISSEKNHKNAKVRIIFQDKYGNIPLPGKANEIEVTLSQGSTLGNVKDQLDGEYIQDIAYNPKLGKPIISVKYGDINFPEIPLVFIPNWEIGPATWWLFWDNKLALDDASLFGFQTERRLNDYLYLQGSFAGGSVKDSLANSGTVFLANLDLKAALNKGSFFSPFISCGISLFQFYNVTTDRSALGANIGLGFNLLLSDRIGLMLEAKDHFLPNFNNQTNTHNIMIGGALIYNFF